MKSETGFIVESQSPVKQAFKEVSNTPHVFFDILPTDWQDSIVPFWKNYKKTARIFTLEAVGKVIGGGIVFSTPAPDTLDEEQAQALFADGQLYIGFLWIAEDARGCNLGSKWISEVRSVFKGRHLWLTIDEYRLKSFYNKNGFDLIGEVAKGDAVEWVMTDKIF